MIIVKWNVYCNTESAYVHGYMHSSSGYPSVCFNNNAHSIDTTKTKVIEEIPEIYTNELVKWNIYCDTEQTYVTGYSDVDPYPEHCFNNIDHVVSQKPIELQRVRNNLQSVKIIEEAAHLSEPTGGYFRSDGFEISAVANTTTIKDFSWPYPISALILRFSTEETHRGDYINCYVKPSTCVGNLSSNISASTYVLPVISTTGFAVNMSVVITDSVNTESLGKITSIDTENSTVTVQTATQFSYYKHAYICYYNPVGTVTSAVTSGDYEITCSSTVIDNVKKGMILWINDATNSEKLGEVFHVDSSTNKITIQSCPTYSYATGSYLTMQLNMIKKYKLGPPISHLLGSGKIGGSYIPKFNIISIEYTNNSVSTQKDFNWYTEVLY